MADEYDVDPKIPSWEDRHTPFSRAYGTLLQGLIKNRSAGAATRQTLYDRLAGNQLGAEEAIRSNAASAYGGNPSGRTGALIAQQRANAPFGAADLAAKQAGKREIIEIGQAGLAKNQAAVNRYISLLSPALQNEQIENQTALGMAQIEANSELGLPSSGSDNALLGSGIGAVGSIASALVLSGVI